MAWKRPGLRAGAAAALTAVALTAGVSAIVHAAGGSGLLPQGEQLAGDLIGAPTPVLLESVHATGKAASIVGDTWPVESRTIADDAAGVLAQTVWMYPVVGAEGTFVLANGDGQVLSRQDGSRMLELLDVTGDEAAASELSTWIQGANGAAAKFVNTAPFEGKVQALDLYDLDTSENADIQTWDDSGAAVQSWTVHDFDARTDIVGELVAPGAVPAVPTTVIATYSWGMDMQLTDIAWNLPEATAWNADGLVEFTGSATGAFGEAVTVEASYRVGTVGDALDSALETFAGVTVSQLRMAAPRTVERSISGSTLTVTAEVTWDWASVSDSDLASVGEVRIPAVEGTGFAATLLVTVAEAEPVNLLRSGVVFHAIAEVGSGVGGLTDGSRASGGMYDWRSGGAGNRANPNLVTFYLDVPQQITGAGVYALMDDAQNRNIGSVTVQYRDLIGGWYDLPLADGAWPLTNEGAGLSLEVEAAEPVVATAVRVRFWNKSNDTWMGLSEIEIFGPRAAQAR